MLSTNLKKSINSHNSETQGEIHQSVLSQLYPFGEFNCKGLKRIILTVVNHIPTVKIKKVVMIKFIFNFCSNPIPIYINQTMITWGNS